MIELELSNEAFEEVRDKCIAAGLIADEPREWDEDSKPFTVGGITFKEWKYVPTPEEIARQEEFRRTPFGQAMDLMFMKQAGMLADLIGKPNYLLDGVDTAGMKVGTTLRIRLPNDFVVRDGPRLRELPKDHFVHIGSGWLDK